MNERIDELMIEAGARFEFLHGVHYDDFQYKKFAELIVQECGNWIVENAGAMEHLGPDYFAKAMTKNFGVEE
jgi:hypothetical protein